MDLKQVLELEARLGRLVGWFSLLALAFGLAGLIVGIARLLKILP